MTRVNELFEHELRRRGIGFTVAEDGRYLIRDGARAWQVSLSNLARELDGGESDAGRISSFVDKAFHAHALPTWGSASTTVFWSAEPSDSEFGDTIREAVTETVTRVLVVTNAEQGLLTWV